MSAQYSLVLATRNPGKLREFRRLLKDLDGEVEWLLSDLSCLQVPDFEETGETFAENARCKALHAASHTGKVCLGEDSGLEVDALGGAPGVRSHRFSPSGDDHDNNELLLASLNDVHGASRSARYRCAIAVAFPGGILAEAEGTVEGRIDVEYKGENGFGYDPLFYCGDLGMTLGEASDRQKDSVSHRRRALEAILPKLRAALAAMGRLTEEEGCSW